MKSLKNMLYCGYNNRNEMDNEAYNVPTDFWGMHLIYFIIAAGHAHVQTASIQIPMAVHVPLMVTDHIYTNSQADEPSVSI